MSIGFAGSLIYIVPSCRLWGAKVQNHPHLPAAVTKSESYIRRAFSSFSGL